MVTSHERGRRRNVKGKRRKMGKRIVKLSRLASQSQKYHFMSQCVVGRAPGHCHCQSRPSPNLPHSPQASLHPIIHRRLLRICVWGGTRNRSFTISVQADGQAARCASERDRPHPCPPSSPCPSPSIIHASPPPINLTLKYFYRWLETSINLNAWIHSVHACINMWSSWNHVPRIWYIILVVC
jgi:hypothetical protein